MRFGEGRHEKRLPLDMVVAAIEDGSFQNIAIPKIVAGLDTAAIGVVRIK